MKKIAAYAVLLVSSSFYLISSSDPLTSIIVDYKTHYNSLVGSDNYHYGDLYGFSRLARFRKIDPANNHPDVKRHKCTVNGRKNLYMLCDSYIWSYAGSDSFYCGVQNLTYATINKKEILSVTLDTTEENILILEFAERNFLPMVDNNFDYLLSFIATNHSIKRTTYAGIKQFARESSAFFFNKNININLEYTFWETSVFTPIRELKAAINLKLFGRLDKDVVLGTDGKYLLFKETVDTTLITSSFRKISDRQIDTVATRLNVIYNHYKSLGFKEVYFSIIPNPVSILYPDFRGLHYNNLIPRVEKSKALKIKSIDIYHDFKSTHIQVYQHADTHWNRNGVNIWLNKVNDILEKL